MEPNLDRFSRPLHGEREPKLVDHCSHCSEELYEGMTVTTFIDNDYFCDTDCLHKFLEVREEDL